MFYVLKIKLEQNLKQMMTVILAIQKTPQPTNQKNPNTKYILTLQ